MKATKKVLLVEDNSGDVRLLREILNEDSSHSFELANVGSMAEAEKHLAAHAVDIVLLDLGLPDTDGLAGIRRARAAAPGIPLVVLTGMDDEGLAAQALQEGAQDYLIKGEIETRGLLRALRYAGERKRLERLKDEFVATVSHELRTPLTSITAALGLLRGEAAVALSRPSARLLDIAHRNSERLVRLVNDILDIEKLESGRATFDFERVEVRSLVADAVLAIRSFAEANGVRVRVDGAVALNEARADIDRLAQVVTNLLSNAIKFSPPDGEVVVTVETDADIVRISVRDHGSGIPAAFQSSVFERFAQADATDARRKGGSGLGLSIVKQIMDRLAGEVGFSDAPGGGTIFRVEVPIWTDHAGETSLQVAAARSPKPSHPHLTAVSRLPVLPDEGRGGHVTLRILHVDDEPDIREVVKISLGLDRELETRSCASGQQALIVAAEWNPHVILLDVMMPVMDGTRTLAHLQENPLTAAIPVVFLTARAESHELDMLRSIGAVGVIQKPFDPATLAASVKGWIKPPDDRIGAMRGRFMEHVERNLVTLAGHRRALEQGIAVPSSLAGIRSIAHGLAGTSGIFGFDDISEAAATVEEVVLRHDGTGAVSEIGIALDRLTACSQMNGHRQNTPDRIYK